MGEKSPTVSNDWIICRSKSRQNRFYSFNKKTGETKWCTEATVNKPGKAVSLKDVQTPAQDRLKRLQNDLQKRGLNDAGNEKKKGVRHGGKSLNLSTTKSKNTERNQSASEAKHTPTSCSKRQRASHPQGIPKEAKHAELTEKTRVTSAVSVTNADKTQLKPADKKSCSKSKYLPISQTDDKDTPTVQNDCSRPRQEEKSRLPVTKSALATETSAQPDADDKVHKSGFVYSLKKLFDRVTGKSKKANLPTISKATLKPKNIITPNKALLREILQKNDNVSVDVKAQLIKRKSSSQTSLSLPAVPNESANARLQRLRKSLQQQVSQQTTASHVPANVTLPTVTSSPKSASLDSEPMDWEPISNENIISITKDPSSSKASSEYFARVNENLLRLAAEKGKTKQWKSDHFYFIVDTNVFINCLTFVDELIQMKLCDTQGTLIYVPYCVLQELDKLKMRHTSESIKLRATRAIRYLNKAFEDNNPRIYAQSGSDESNHLIQVRSPDDSILNCCLQVKKHVDNVLLLTEDVNLQNKAISNSILVSSKSDLISKHESLV